MTGAEAAKNSRKMKESRYFYEPDVKPSGELSAEESAHAVRVLRLKEGDTIFLIDGKGTFHEAAVSLVNARHCMYEVVKSIPQEKRWKANIHLAIAPTKTMERMEWLVEKATEIGFDSLTLLDCKFSERKTLRTDRLERIVISAVKQSRKPWLPVVNGMTAYQEFVKRPTAGRKFIAHCYAETDRNDLYKRLKETNTEEDITVMIGPEGDFSIEEVRLAEHNGYEAVTLGESRLRTETAGLYAVMMSQLAQRI